MDRKRFLKNAAVLTAGGLLSKVIGAVYRIPLTGLLGGYGMGLYQMAYPLFCVLLTFSSAGIPSAFSRIIAGETARGREDGGTVRSALRLFALLGLAGSLSMCLIAGMMSDLQGESALVRCYRMLAPSVFFVSVIAVLRGYFQGKNDMAPTAFSEVLEQLGKAAVGLFLAMRFRGDPARAAAGTLFAVTVSELLALVYLAMRYKGAYHVRGIPRKMPSVSLLAAVLPVMAATSLLPLSQTADSVVIVRLLARHSSSAVALYGLFAGGAVTLMSLPATACYGLAAAVVPAISAACAKGDAKEGQLRALYALSLTLLLAVPAAVCLFAFARPVVALLYPSLAAEEAQTLVRLVRCMAISAVFLAGTDTLAACLTGMGRAKHAACSMLCAVAVKHFLQFLLVSDARLGILGAAAAANACYLIAFFLDLVYTVKKEKAHDHDYRSRRGREHVQPCGSGASAGSGRGHPSHGISLRGDPRGDGHSL